MRRRDLGDGVVTGTMTAPASGAAGFGFGISGLIQAETAPAPGRSTKATLDELEVVYEPQQQTLVIRLGKTLHCMLCGMEKVDPEATHEQQFYLCGNCAIFWLTDYVRRLKARVTKMLPLRGDPLTIHKERQTSQARSYSRAKTRRGQRRSGRPRLAA
jgi:hypothetical protein